MNNTFKKFIVALLIASLFVFPMAGVNGGVQAQDSFPPALEPYLSADGLTLYNGVAPLVVVVDPNPAMQGIKIPAPEVDKALADPAAASATFLFTYVEEGGKDPWGQVCTTFPEDAKAAFKAAADIWASTLQSSVPITIQACWASLPSPTTLGYSGGQPLHPNFSGAPKTNTWYEGALANSLSGSDLEPTMSDMNITYNSNFAWYTGTDSDTPSGQYDLVTVATHEIAHGLNFSGIADYSGRLGSYGSKGYPNVYDTFMEDNGGRKLTSYPNPSAELGTLLTSGSLWFNGSNANAANGGTRVKMYAPPSWNKGSSYGHLDYSTFADTPNKMMVYVVASGSANHNPGLVTTGLLKDLGWVLAGESTISGNAGVDGATLSYMDGTPKTATANGSGLYSFAVSSGWSGMVTPSKTGYTFSPVNRTYPNILANQTSQDYTASLNTYLLSVSKTGTSSGTVTSNPAGIDCGSDCSEAYNYNTSVTLTATAATGSTFTGWSSSGCSGTSACMVTMDADKSVTASFNLDTYRIYLPLVVRDLAGSPPGDFNKSAPANGATSQQANPTLSWGASSNATSYEYCIDTSNNNACDTTWASTAASTSVGLSGLTPTTPYYWQVRANNASGTTNADGGTWWSFTTAASPPGGRIVNGDFESGSTGWTEHSDHGLSLIMSSSSLPVAPHNGSYAAELGGLNYEIAYLQQQVTIPSSAPYLVYWQWIASADVCGFDFGGVVINGTVIDEYNLCDSTSTGGWVTHSVNLSAYAGQSVMLQIRIETDSSDWSNLYVDDVSLQASASALGPIQGVAPNLDASTTQGKIGSVAQGEKPQGIGEKRLLNPR